MRLVTKGRTRRRQGTPLERTPSSAMEGVLDLMANQYRYPTGVRPLLAAEAARRKRIEWRFAALLEQSRFDEVVLPIIDYVEPYTGVIGRDAGRQSYRFIDREGELVAIRSDFTPMVARVLAPTIAQTDLPLRVFYRGDVIRCRASQLGTNREMFQIGAEIIGEPSVDADIEILRLAAECLSSFGVRPLVVYTDVSIAEALIGAGSDDQERAAIRARLRSKRSGQGETAQSSAIQSLIQAVAGGTASLDDLERWPPTALAAARLRAIGEALGSHGNADFVLHLDDVEPAVAYYTGIRFRIYGQNARTLVGQGGRYDDLYGQFGGPAPAIGFTFTIDDVGEASTGVDVEAAESTPAVRDSPHDASGGER
jgi:ATP phosphoribosyltransferase regulatory subunit